MSEETKFDSKELIEKINTEIKALEENQEFLGDYATTIGSLRQIKENISGKKIEFSDYLKLTRLLIDVEFETSLNLGLIEEEEEEEER